MQHSFNDKFKERTPQETINIIKSFFLEKGFNISIAFCAQSEESQTWSTRVHLMHNNIIVLGANGKGIEKIFALASGYAELYERYCNKMFYINNPFVFDKVINNNHLKYGYFLDPQEQIISFEEATKYFKNFFVDVEDKDSNQAKNFFSTIHKQFIGIPYQNINSEDILFLDPRLVTWVNNSTGMSSGNNFYEAFNQGMSEICEHHVTGQYLHNLQECYYVIDNDSITNPLLKNIINSIEKENNKLYIYDFSYIYHIPVLMSLLINYDLRTCSVNFGSFPVFDIALERILTELYQGVSSYGGVKLGGQVPYRNREVIQLELSEPGCTQLKCAIPEEILLRTKIVSPNFKVFLKNNKTYSNKELFVYYQNLCKQNNINVYYYDNSQTKDMSALQIVALNYSGLSLNNLNKLASDKSKVYIVALKLYNYLNNLLLTKNFDFIELHKLVKLFSTFNIYEELLLNYLMFHDWFLTYSLNDQRIWYILERLLLQLELNETDIEYMIKECNLVSELNVNCIKYLLLIRYTSQNKYSNNEIVHIFSKLGLDVSVQDLMNINNKEYLVNKMFIEPLLTNMSSNDYFEKLSWDINLKYN